MVTTIASGRAFLQLQAAFAERACKIICQRVDEGLIAARARGFLEKTEDSLGWVAEHALCCRASSAASVTRGAPYLVGVVTWIRRRDSDEEWLFHLSPHPRKDAGQMWQVDRHEALPEPGGRCL